MRLPAETVEELNDEATAWRLLEPWGITPVTAKLERHTVYTFQARWCDTWRRGRLLLAGDSAHLMPPFAGQGMCSGLRDAVNLAWKLGLVLDGRAHDGILDSYGPERAEHVRHFIEASMSLGEVICLPDPVAAAERDRAMQADLAAGVQQPPRPLPKLGPGLHRGDAGGGVLSIQAEVSDGEVPCAARAAGTHSGERSGTPSALLGVTGSQVQILSARQWNRRSGAGRSYGPARLCMTTAMRTAARGATTATPRNGESSSGRNRASRRQVWPARRSSSRRSQLCAPRVPGPSG
jgi:hypothetical protein